MGIISPIISSAVDLEADFPAPSEREKIQKLIEKYRTILRKYPGRPDIGEIKFGLADLYVGRGDAGDYDKAKYFYEDILKTCSSPFLRARAFVGKAELSVPGIKKEEIQDAIDMCATARKNLGDDISDFFTAKTYIVEADLRLVRNDKGDHGKALKMHEKLIQERKANWYFRARALLGKAELILYHYPAKLTDAIGLCARSSKLLKDRPADYFSVKTKTIESELRIRRAKAEDFKAAENLLKEVIRIPHAFADLTARAKTNLAEISKHPLASKLLKELHQMEGLDPYLTDKIKQIEAGLKTK
ncbi:MAG: hypothetical protein FD145_1393 [Candidatus Saganbacteria bacterium]|uniref:Tetratricopeptide repeat protein n=1 Tax=Candidatus Saganbacteria bacterium TaxID=2575572 RepID=A0A833KZW2_UNCSA|nr:MAG: hypothetical protein FD145_1393 [Candidatus Saganbacteria bacterium]